MIVNGCTLPRRDLAELLSKWHCHKEVTKLRRLNIFTKRIICIRAEPRHKENQCIRLVVETRNNAHTAVESGYDSQEESNADSLTVEPELEPRDILS